VSRLDIIEVNLRDPVNRGEIRLGGWVTLIMQGILAISWTRWLGFTVAAAAVAVIVAEGTVADMWLRHRDKKAAARETEADG